MEFEHSFTIPVPPDEAWEVLLDVERVAPCMPGATVDTVDGDDLTGRVKVKVGPITMTYRGHARFVERDEAAHTVTIEASGKEARGTGTASAKVHAALRGDDGQTRVTMSTTLNVTGRPAQMGRGVLADVSAKLIEQFAANLAKQLASNTAPASTAGGTAPGNTVTENTVTESTAPENTAPGDTVPGDTAEDRAATSNVASGPTAGPGQTPGGGNRGGNGTGRAATTAPPSPTPAAADISELTTATATEADQQDALNLLGVAAGPVLKRLIPALGALFVALFLARVRRRRKRRKRLKRA